MSWLGMAGPSIQSSTRSYTNTHHTRTQVVAGDGQGVPVGRISREDVAALCVASLESAKASHATLSCVSTTAQKPGKRRRGDKQGPTAAPEEASSSPAKKAAANSGTDALFPYKLLLRREGRPDATPLRRKPHRLAALVFVAALAAAVTGLGFAAAQAAAWALGVLRWVWVCCGLWVPGVVVVLWVGWLVGRSVPFRSHVYAPRTPPTNTGRPRRMRPLPPTLPPCGSGSPRS